MITSPATSGEPADDAVDVLARALQPIIAAFQERAVGVGDWIEAIKVASYRATHAATNAEAGRAVFARMAIRTGMTRSELVRLRERMSQGSLSRRDVGRHRLTRVINGWRTDSRFLDEQAQPRPLTIHGAAPNLKTLARAFAGDVPPISVVLELQRARMIRSKGDGMFVPSISRQKLGLEGALKFERLMREGTPEFLKALTDADVSPSVLVSEVSAMVTAKRKNLSSR